MAQRYLWLAPLAIGFPAILAYFALPEAIQNVAYQAFGTAATIAVLAAIAIHRPAQPWLWALVAAGFGLWTLGDATAALLAPDGGNVPVPSWADVCYFAGYASLILGVGLLAGPVLRGSRIERPALLDAGIVATAAAFPIWLIVISPLVNSEGTDLVQALVAAAYPVMDVLIIAVAARHLLVEGSKTPAAILLVTALGVYLAADLGYVHEVFLDTYSSSDFVNAGWLAGYTLAAAAALHPSMAEIGPRTEEMRPLSIARRMLLVTAAIVPAVAVLLHDGDSFNDRLVLASGTALLVGLVLARLFGVLRDQQELRQRMHFEARHDPLTGLSNRKLFAERLNDAIEASPNGVGILYLDLDGFKLVNDRLGHPAGDAVLLAVAERLNSRLRRGDDVARLGGDEFAVIIDHADDEKAVVAVAQRMLEALATPAVVSGQTIELRASIGIAWRGFGGASADELLRRADVAMYAAKTSRRPFVLYEPTLDPPIEPHVSLEPAFT